MPTKALAGDRLTVAALPLPILPLQHEADSTWELLCESRTGFPQNSRGPTTSQLQDSDVFASPPCTSSWSLTPRFWTGGLVQHRDLL